MLTKLYDLTSSWQNYTAQEEVNDAMESESFSGLEVS
jgi:hypothetical protein